MEIAGQLIGEDGPLNDPHSRMPQASTASVSPFASLSSLYPMH